LIAWQELANLTTVKQVWDARGWSAATSDFDNIVRSVRAAVPTLANRTSAETEAPSPDGPVRAEPSRPPAPDTGKLLRSILSSQALIAAVAEIDARYDAVQKIAADA
ncbi:MAG: hypothetical protein ACK58T_28795, partial [Phycisphaerae bacterium]